MGYESGRQNSGHAPKTAAMHPVESTIYGFQRFGELREAQARPTRQSRARIRVGTGIELSGFAERPNHAGNGASACCAGI